jgi:uncharacterized protein (TIGR02145 family)
MNRTKVISLTAGLVLAITFTLSCEDKEAKDKPSAEAPSAAAPKEGTFTDPRDGKKYKFVRIGEQVWMAENLNFAAEGSKCYGEDAMVVISRDDFDVIAKTLSPAEVQANCDKYGRLYDWRTASKACPSGWHLPTYDEYNALYNTVGGDSVAGKKLKAKSGWDNEYEGKPGNGTDDFGFSAMPGGYDNLGSHFDGAGKYGNWWSDSEYNVNEVYLRTMYYDREHSRWENSDKKYSYSVRCIQD